MALSMLFRCVRVALIYLLTIVVLGSTIPALLIWLLLTPSPNRYSRRLAIYFLSNSGSAVDALRATKTNFSSKDNRDGSSALGHWRKNVL